MKTSSPPLRFPLALALRGVTLAATLITVVAPSGCSSSSNPAAAPKEINCCIIQTLIRACPGAYDATAVSIADSGNDEECLTWLNDTPEGESGRSCVNGFGTPIETVGEASATCSE